jgi:5'(3')-deoxyribonucleotidase
LHRFAVNERDLFRTLEPIPGAPAALRRIANGFPIRIRIITHRLFISHSHRTAITQTVEWLDHFGIPYWDLCFMRDKAAVGADLYLEDSPPNIKALRTGNHKTIVFSNSTNRDVEGPRAENWNEVEAAIGEYFELWSSDLADNESEGN